MKQYRSIFFCFCLLLLLPGYSFAQEQKQLNWQMVTTAPFGKDVSGVYAGVINDRLYVIGGEQNKKANDEIYVLEEGNEWQLIRKKLPKGMAFGHSVSHNNSIFLIGGKSGGSIIPDVYRIYESEGNLIIDSLPSLPRAQLGITGTVLGNFLIVAGGSADDLLSTKTFLVLDLLHQVAGWASIDSWNGPARSYAKSASLDNEFYLFGGVLNDGDSSLANLADAYKFTPELKSGRLTGGKWTTLKPAPGSILKTPSVLPVTGLNHILFPGAGSDKSDSLFAYNRESNSWINYGKLKVADPEGFSNAVRFGDGWLILNDSLKGEAQFTGYKLAKDLGFGIVNWITLAIYLILMLWIGFATNKKGQTTNNFFTAGGKIPAWAAGLSIYGTQISAITFMAMPALVFATDWTLIIGSVLILTTAPIVSKYYVPFFRRLSVTSAYEYLEHRFSRNVRLLGSISFILFQMGRMGIVLYLPAVAIASVTGIDIYLLIGIMGIICIIYTVLGGIEAVVWTDVAQVIILMGGAILCLVIAVMNIDGGLETVFRKGMELDKFTLIKPGWSYSDTVLWVCIVGFFFLNIIPYTSDQAIVQRYFTVKDEKEAERSLWVNAWITMPGTLVFFGLGTVLYVFYNQNPSVIASDKVDEILPYFVVQQLPVGISGLVIAGIFAASQSTLSGSINSISASYFSDIYQRFNKNNNVRSTLRIARITTIVAGLFGTVSAMLIVALNVRFAFDLFQEVLGILGGSLAGVFVLGIFTQRANAPGVIIGLFAGVAAVWWMRNNTTVSVYLYGAVSIISCVMVGYLCSLLFPKTNRGRGLSYASLKELQNRA